MHRLRSLPPLLLAAAALSAAAADRNLVWANRGSDMNAAANWNDAATGAAATSAPASADRLFFPGRPGVQPRLTASLEVRAVCFGPIGTSGRTEADTGDGYGGFDHCGWTITGASGAELRIPGSWNEGKNWNFAFSQASYGTNTVAVPVRFTNAGGGYRPVMPSHGRLVFAAAVASDSAAATVLCNGEDGFVELAAANPELACAIQTDAACSLCFSHPQALSAVTRLVLNDNTYPVRTARFRNETGAPAQITSVAEIAQTQNTADLHFEGAAMSFPNATFRQDGSKGRRLYSLDVPVTVRSLGNAVSNAGAYGFWKLGAAPLRVTGDMFGDAPEGQTNRLVVLDGALVLEDGGYLSRDRIVFGKGGYNNEFNAGARPAFGLLSDLVLPAGDGPGAFASYTDQRCAMGIAAFGGDRAVTLAGGGPYVFGDGPVSVPLSGYTAANFRLRAETLVFGARGADGTVTLASDVDLNREPTHSSVNFRELYAVQGDAPVAGRIAGHVYNTAGKGDAMCRLFKCGDGVLALDGDCSLASGDRSEVREGGLLVNAGFAGPLVVGQSGTEAPAAWLGGTGRLASTVTVRGGAALRPGDERGEGTLELAGSLALEDGARVVVAVGPGSNTSVRFTGVGCDYRAAGRVTLRIEVEEGLEIGRDVKIFDWTESSSPSYLTMCDPSRYDFELPEGSPVLAPRLVQEGDALWLKFSVDRGAPFKLLFL